MEACDAGRLVIAIGPQGRKGCDYDVVQAVEICLVEGEGNHYGLGAYHLYRTDEAQLESLGQGSVVVRSYWTESVIPSFFAAPGCTAFQENRSVGFLEEEEPEQLNEGVRDCDDPKAPAPGDVSSNETSCYGSKGGSAQMYV